MVARSRRQLRARCRGMGRLGLVEDGDGGEDGVFVGLDHAAVDDHVVHDHVRLLKLGGQAKGRRRRDSVRGGREPGVRAGRYERGQVWMG